MLYDKYSTHDGLMNYDNEYFDYDTSEFVDFYKNNQQSLDQKTLSTNNLNNQSLTTILGGQRLTQDLDRFQDGSAPPNENQDHIDDPTILQPNLSNDSIPKNQDYVDNIEPSNSRIYDNYDKYHNTKRIEPYNNYELMGNPNSILNNSGKRTKSRFTNKFLDDFVWSDIVIFLHIIITVVLAFYIYKIMRKLKKMKHKIKEKLNKKTT
jgi:hypothetical protein